MACVSLDTLDFYEYDTLLSDSRDFLGASGEFIFDGENALKMACGALES